MGRYFRNHWRGDQPLLLVTLVNGVLGYVVFVAAMFGLTQVTANDSGWLVSLATVLFIAWAVWASVGIVRCVLKRYTRSAQPAWRRLVGTTVIIIIAVVDLLSARDLVMALWPW